MAWEEVKKQRTSVELENEKWLKLQVLLEVTKHSSKLEEEYGSVYWGELQKDIDEIKKAIDNRSMKEVSGND